MKALRVKKKLLRRASPKREKSKIMSGKEFLRPRKQYHIPKHRNMLQYGLININTDFITRDFINFKLIDNACKI